MTIADEDFEGKLRKAFHPKHSYPVSVREALTDYCPNDSYTEAFRDIPWPFAVKRLTQASQRLVTASQGALTAKSAKELVAYILGMQSWKELKGALADIEAYDVWQHFNPTEFFYHRLIEAKTADLYANMRVFQLLKPEENRFYSAEYALRPAMRRFLEATSPIEELSFATPAQNEVLAHTHAALSALNLPDAEALTEHMWCAPARAVQEANAPKEPGSLQPWVNLNLTRRQYAYRVALDLLRKQQPDARWENYWLTGEQFRDITKTMGAAASEGVSQYTVSWAMLCQVLPQNAVLHIETQCDFGALGVTAIHCEQSTLRKLKRLGWYPDYGWNSHDWRRFRKDVPLAQGVKPGWGLAVGAIM